MPRFASSVEFLLGASSNRAAIEGAARFTHENERRTRPFEGNWNFAGHLSLGQLLTRQRHFGQALCCFAHT
jgi:hypothetical protein